MSRVLASFINFMISASLPRLKASLDDIVLIFDYVRVDKIWDIWGIFVLPRVCWGMFHIWVQFHYLLINTARIVIFFSKKSSIIKNTMLKKKQKKNQYNNSYKNNWNQFFKINVFNIVKFRI